jgi:hypothetical protein
MQNRLQLAAPWEEVKERLKEINTDLTDEDLEYIPGEEETLLKRLSGIMNWKEDQVRQWIESVSANDSIAS